MIKLFGLFSDAKSRKWIMNSKLLTNARNSQPRSRKNRWIDDVFDNVAIANHICWRNGRRRLIKANSKLEIKHVTPKSLEIVKQTFSGQISAIFDMNMNEFLEAIELICWFSLCQRAIWMFFYFDREIALEKLKSQ